MPNTVPPQCWVGWVGATWSGIGVNGLRVLPRHYGQVVRTTSFQTFNWHRNGVSAHRRYHQSGSMPQAGTSRNGPCAAPGACMPAVVAAVARPPTTGLFAPPGHWFVRGSMRRGCGRCAQRSVRRQAGGKVCRQAKAVRRCGQGWACVNAVGVWYGVGVCVWCGGPCV